MRRRRLPPFARAHAAVPATRDADGKVTLAFPKGLQGLEKAEVLTAVEQILKEMG